ncbi:MAG: hypothetical protein U0174_09905 [Polyangiaceae bacterium]
MKAGHDSWTASKVCAAIALLTLTACKSTKESEGERMLAAVTEYRRATNAEVGPAALALEETPCTDEDVCKLKTACVASARPTRKAAELKKKLETQVSAVSARGPDAGPLGDAGLDLLAQIDEVEKLLKEGKEALGACDVEEQRFRRIVRR